LVVAAHLNRCRRPPTSPRRRTNTNFTPSPGTSRSRGLQTPCCSTRGYHNILHLKCNHICFELFGAHLNHLRRVFSSPHDSPPALDVAEGGGGGGDGIKTSESSAKSGRLPQHDFTGASSSAPAPLPAGETQRVVRYSDPDDLQPLISRSSSQHPGAPERAPSSDPTHESTSHMGGDIETATHREHVPRRERIAPTPTSEDDGTDEVPEELILGRSLRPGRIPTLRPRTSTEPTHSLVDIDEAAAALGDAEAALLVGQCTECPCTHPQSAVAVPLPSLVTSLRLGVRVGL